MMYCNRRRVLGWLVLMSSLLFTACQGGGQGAADDAEAAMGERVENPANGVALAGVPAFFRLQSNDEAGIVLVPADAAVAGTLTVKAGAQEVGGINLIAAIEQHKEAVLARQDGDYKGQRELGSQLGTAFYSRGHYTGDDGVRLEETIVFLVHPWGDRTLQLVYVYPAGEDSGTRIQEQLFGVLGEVEALGSEPPTTDQTS